MAQASGNPKNGKNGDAPPNILPESEGKAARPISPKTDKKDKCRFESCRKKLRLADPACRCGMRFCMAHRLPEQHHCTFDYKTHGREGMKKDSVKCDSDRGLRRI
eukprot:scpid106620/ scgid12462/ Zinc finger A20 and AN1 domain-containing stress-associated protein 6